MSKENELDLSDWEQASGKKMLSFSFAYLLFFFFGGQLQTYLFYYYNIEIGMPVILLGVAFVIFAVYNAINDPLFGYLTDRPFKWTRRWGMRFPWMLIGAIPMLICWYLLFAVPDGLIESSDPLPLFLYFIIIACALDTFYTIYTTHLGASYTVHFRTDAERRRMSAISNLIPNILGVVLGLLVPIFYIYGNRDSMIFAQTLIILLLFVALIIAIPGLRESEDLKERFLKGYENSDRDPYWPTMKAAFKRKSFTASLLCFMFLSFGAILAAATSVYFFKDIYKLPYEYAAYTSITGFVGFLVSIPFWTNMARKHGASQTMKIGLFFGIFAYLPGLWISTLVEAIIFAVIGGFVIGAFWTTLGPVVADVYDECTIHTGKHQEATYEAFRAFFNRFSFAIVGIIIPIVQITTGYNTNPNATQTPLAIWGLRIQAAVIPSLFCLMAYLVMKRMYDLEGEKQINLKRKLKEMGL